MATRNVLSRTLSAQAQMGSGPPGLRPAPPRAKADETNYSRTCSDDSIPQKPDQGFRRGRGRPPHGAQQAVTKNSKRRRGSALLTVLWLSAALAAVAFALSSTVRGETERAATAQDGLRSQYLASAAVERAGLELLWSALYPDRRTIPAGATQVDLDFPTGVAHVEIIPETAKLNVNTVSVEDLLRLGTALGLDPARAALIAQGIEARRRPILAGQLPVPGVPTFQAPAASFQEIEELLLVNGVTPEILYGTYVPSTDPDAEIRLIPRAGLADCLSVFGSSDRVDANTAHPAVLAVIGINPQAIAALVERRRLAPLSAEQLGSFLESVGAPSNRLRVGGNSIVTLRASARLKLADGRLSDLKRAVAAQVKFMPTGYGSPIHILRWYDAAWSN